MKKVYVLNHGEHGTAPTGHDSIRGSMYVRATRFSAGRSVVAGAFVLAFALYDSVAVQPVLAQTIGRPNVIVDESVLDQLGPPPQTLPDVLLQQQPQAYRPATRGSDAAGMPAQSAPSTGQLLPPPSSMPHSRVMLPRALQPATRTPAPPQIARVPKPTPRPVTPVETAPLVKPPAEPAAPAVVPTEIAPPPAAKVPDAPKVAPPPPEAAAPAVEAPKPLAAVPEPSEPPVAKVEMPKAPPPPAPLPPASLPKVEPPAPPVAAAPAPKAPEKPSVAAIPPVPEVVPPPPAPAVKAPVAEAPPAPKPVRPAPRKLSAAPPATDPKPESGGDTAGEKTRTQIAALPSAPAEVLDGGQMYRIPFGPDSSDISDNGKKYLDELAQRMKSDSALRLQLLGYAGSTQDSASKARRTSLFRALSVRTYLMKQGIRSTRMDVRALGNLVEDGAPDRVDAVVRK
jgi:outer membrane protein OmpA-like peptidoglycan-associated protein